jgi:3',5'-cyclic AMP phosphodiesterase CpdA
MENSGRWDRRGVLRAGIGALGLGAAARAGDDAAFHFAVLNDLHVVDDACGAWLAGVLAGVKTRPEKPQFVLVAGDLTENGTEAQLSIARRVLDGCGLPYHVTIGNHDYLTQKDRAPYDRLFPHGLNVRFDHRGWQFLGLDSSEGQKYQKTSVQPAALKWLEEEVGRLDRERPTVLFTHFPMGPLTPMRPINAAAVLERLDGVRLTAAFCGHFHGFTERRHGKTVITTNRCCSLKRNNHDQTPEKGYFLCRAAGELLERIFVRVEVTS